MLQEIQLSQKKNGYVYTMKEANKKDLGGFLYWGNTANMEAMDIGGIIVENNPLIFKLHLQTVCIQ